jgi:hypothetical protein
LITYNTRAPNFFYLSGCVGDVPVAVLKRKRVVTLIPYRDMVGEEKERLVRIGAFRNEFTLY